ncbi:MAG: phosphodiester glycosidase family protein [Acidimicrobiales bacterium]
MQALDPPSDARGLARLSALVGLTLALAACGVTVPNGAVAVPTGTVAMPTNSSTRVDPPRPSAPADHTSDSLALALDALAKPAPLAPFSGTGASGASTWRPAGRLVGGVPAIYETALTPPGGTQPAYLAWMDTGLLSARLYSGSRSPGGGPYRFTAPIRPAQAGSVVAAFNGGFLSNTGGGYYTEGRAVYPLVSGLASLVIYAGGRVNIGSWGQDVGMTPQVVSVRQNLVPLVVGGRPSAQASSANWQAWGSTCGATSCAASVPGIEHQWRSGIGIRGDGALVYVTGAGLDPAQLAQVLVRAGAVRAMELDINPFWTVLATYDPSGPGGLATASNGSRLDPGSVQGPQTFLDPSWARDFVTMSARPAPAG